MGSGKETETETEKEKYNQRASERTVGTTNRARPSMSQDHCV
jgi:hypothetical protein